MAESVLPPELAGYTGELRAEEPLSKHTYYRIGGPAQWLAIPRSREDLRLLAAWAAARGIPAFVAGLGSNLLASDQGYPGLMIKASRLDLTIECVEENRLRTGGSVAISSLLRRAGEEGWGGLELWAGIPGSIGGAVAMNAGTHLGESAAIALQVTAWDWDAGMERTYDGAALQFAYRRNLFLPPRAIVLSADWRIQREEPATVRARLDEVLARRKQTQPIDLPSCGSVFKNPRSSGLRAWEVIDRLGLRGHQIGNAQFSPKHPNFIVNLGGARAADVRALIELAQTRARAELSVELETEVVSLGPS